MGGAVWGECCTIVMIMIVYEYLIVDDMLWFGLKVYFLVFGYIGCLVNTCTRSHNHNGDTTIGSKCGLGHLEGSGAATTGRARRAV